MVTDSLGFRLEVMISVGDFPTLGAHVTHEDEDGQVAGDTPHRINIKAGLEAEVLDVVVAHEVYHLFHSVRHLITADEEIEAEAFGELVGRVHKAIHLQLSDRYAKET